jgi:hypothetical protein
MKSILVYLITTIKPGSSAAGEKYKQKTSEKSLKLKK